MFWFSKVIPCFREFTKKELSKTYEKWDSDIHCYVLDTVELSDCELMDKFGKKYCKGYKPSAMAKKLESYRKRLWEFKKDWFIEEVGRVKIPIAKMGEKITTDEIFYKLKNVC